MNKKFEDIFTPEWMVNDILNYIPIKYGDKILEPTAGDGNMAEPILKKCKNLSIELTVNELQKKHYNTLKERLSKYGKIKEVKLPSKQNLFNYFFNNS